ncbi:hypothetical protein ES332_A05G261500v1 [Gossypium tomentosum]|uniref:Uncharacterized protein n=1 Tax=Gossypium tomentosum TaxID=34277 RepID=A0A5D2QKD8_GOSTO|nr:hypothetical protein ES332_A05G261500v1 [Gossypium tomentosum]
MKLSCLHHCLHIYSSGTHVQDNHNRCSQGLEEAACYFLEYFCCHFSLSLCSCPCLDYLGSFSGTNARYRCCNVSRFSGFVHCGALLFGHNLALGYHCICFRRGIWVCSHGEEQKPYQRKARVGDSRVFYPVTDEGVKSMAFKRLVVEGTDMGMATRVVYAIICFLLLSTGILFQLVIQTVVYFVCKSYHH